jgi:hypothetical protein
MKSQQQGQAPDKGRAKAIKVNSRAFDRAYGIGGLKRPGRKMTWNGGNAKQPK